MIRLLFISLACFVLLASCYRPAPRQAFEDLKSLEGSWVTYEGSLFNEYWEVVNDSLMVGMGYSLNGGDTAFKEYIKIYFQLDDVFYAARFDDEEAFTSFKMEEAGENEWKFVNAENEYPNILRYKFINDTLLTASISNIRGNKEVLFKMKRGSE